MSNDLAFIRRSKDVTYCDLAIVDGDLQMGYSLETFVYKALMTDARVSHEEYAQAKLATPKDANPIPLRGWWGDTYPSVEGHTIGSKMWLNKRQKRTNQVLESQRMYIRQALKPLLDDGVAISVDVAVAWEEETMLAEIKITKPDNSVETFRFNYVWEEL